jgi:hypothetical protein
MSARAITLKISGRADQAREAAEEAGHLAERLHYPVGEAAALEALASTVGDPEECRRQMQEARELWDGLGRPLDVAICDLLLGHLLAHAEAPDADELLDKAAAEFERLGVDHLARWARALV